MKINLKMKMLLLLLLSNTLSASSLEMNLNNKTVEGNFDYSFVFDEDLETKLNVGGGILYKKDIYDSTYIYNVKIESQSRLENMPDLKLGLGMKLLYLDEDNINDDFIALPLFFTSEWTIPTTFVIDLGLRGEIYYSPSVLSFKEAKNYFEFKTEFFLKVIQNTELFLGYRYIDREYVNSTSNNGIDNSAYIGGKFIF